GWFTQRLQQRSDGSCRGIGDQGGQSIGADLNAGAASANEDRLPDGCCRQSDRRMAVKYKNPGFRLSQQCPARARRQVNFLENKMSARDKNRPLIRQTGGAIGRSKRPGVGNGYAIVLMQFAPPAVVEQPECRVAVLLNFGEHD